MSALLGSLSFPFAAAAADPGPDVVPTVSASSDAVSVGDTVTFTISVADQGGSVAHGVVLTDDLPTGMALVGPPVLGFGDGSCAALSSLPPGGGPPAYSYYCTVGTLDPGASASVTFPVKVTSDVRCGSVRNTVRAKAKDEPAANRNDNTASATVEVTCPPSIAITKTVPAYARVGARVAFTYRVRNTGDATFETVAVTDPGCDTPPPTSAAPLASGASRVLRCDATITRSTPAAFTSTAMVVGHTADGTARAWARATVRVVRPGVTISVVPSASSGSPGDAIVYRFIVRNTGDATLTDLAVTDDRLGMIGTVDRIAAGGSAVLRTTRVLSATEVWVTDTATVTATEPSGGTVRASDAAVVTIVAADARPGGISDGTAFTGVDVGRPLALAIALAIVGVALLRRTRRRA